MNRRRLGAEQRFLSGLNYSTQCYIIKKGDALRLFKSKWFQRFARKEGIADALLLEAVARAQHGRIDADLGGEVIKQRIARAGQGKSKGYGTIIFFRRGTRAFFMYGFAKNQRANVADDEKERFKDAAKFVLALTEKQLAELLQRGDFVEVKSE